jgi:Ca-activated chloride channel homolog
MKRAASIMIALLAAVQAFGFAFPPRERLQFEGHVNCPAVSTSGGRVYLRLSIVSQDHRRSDRRPVNLAVVLDRSGSMAEQSKMEHAKAALLALVDQLKCDDIFSLVIYDDVVEVARPAGRVGRDKQDIRSLVQEICPRGSTNLGGGMQEGFRQVERNTGREYINRVILLSDGLANQGITDPHRLQGIARRQREHSISLSTVGVGLDYNENLMVGLSENGGGNYYFIESSYNLASILRKEFDRLADVMAQNVTIELELGRGVTLRDAIGFEHSVAAGKVLIPVGDLYGDDTREVMVELDVPPGTGSMALVHGKLLAAASSGTADLGSFDSRIRYEYDARVVEKERNMDEQAKADVAVSTRNVIKAMESLDKGDKDAANQMLVGASQALSASPAAATGGVAGRSIQEQVQRLRGYVDSLQNDAKDGKKAKKAIQYENYMQQKNK